MGRKNSLHTSNNDEEDQQIEMEEKVEKAIKALPSLAEKVQAIAINGYLLEKRELDKKLEAELNQIEAVERKKYDPQLAEVHSNRIQINNIAAGLVELTDADLQGVDHLLTEQEKQVRKNYYPKKQIEEFWLKALRQCDETAEEVHPEDEKPLMHLQKIQAEKTADGKSLTVTFHFSENEWFTNSSIKKQFQIDGDTIKRSYGDDINWKEGKNLTIEIIKKRNKKKKTTTTKEVKKQSFFNIFNEIDLTSDSEDDKEDGKEQDTEVEELEKQYEVCVAIYEQVLPRSLEYFLGVVGATGFDAEDLLGLEGIEEDDEGDQACCKKKKSKSKKRKGSNCCKD